MIRNIRLTIEYDGARFFGWQSQRTEKRKTVQEEIEKAAYRLFGKKIKLVGSGRTDSGVHAEAHVANFKTASNLPLINIKRGLNNYLPKDIAVTAADEVKIDFHSRFDARGKLYRYTILNRKIRSPLLKRYTAFVSYDLNIDSMRKAARCLIGRKDFKSFQAAARKEKSSIRTIKKLTIVSKPPLIEIYIQADGFLYNMVRNIVGTLIDIGRGKFPQGTIKKLIRGKDRSKGGPTAKACGVVLVGVKY